MNSTDPSPNVVRSINRTVAARPAAPPASTSTLRRLYLLRFAFAIAWAALLASTASTLGGFATALLIVYPVFDVVAAVLDGRSAARAGGWPAALSLNIALSAAAAVALGVAGAADIPAVLRVWGAWAIVAGIVQLVVGRSRRRLGGQWPMMLAGGISILAGATFILTAADADSMRNLAGYAVLGGIFFLALALRLGRGPSGPTP